MRCSIRSKPSATAALISRPPAARVADAEELGVLFMGLEALEQMIEVVRSTGEPPPLRPELIDALIRTPTVSPRVAQEGGQAKKSVA